MHEEPIQLSVSRFRVHSEDPSFNVTWRGGSRFVLTGEVNLDPSAELDVSTPNDVVEVSLARRSTPEHAVAMLRRALPRSISMRHHPVEDGVEIVFQEALVPAAKTPRFRIFSTDAQLRVKQLDENKIEFLGGIGEDCLLTVLCDSRRVTISLPRGSSALAIAARVGSNVPHGFRALVDGPVVSVWKDADFFSAVA
ncbi:MAG: hypothetical protein Q8N23_07090 [Archangium sp.]|nr:hypothetical protein [Archangium sp.]MDP3152418.1 hypothetical protein [Archangium sp.]MDP3572412.1 hypothetical protein [Archangium sp.]